MKGVNNMKTITFLNNKGGVGKSTSTTAIASCIAQRGYKVLFVDLDPQGNSSSLYSEMNVLAMAKNMLQGNTQFLGKSVEDLLVNPNENIEDCIQKTTVENVDIIPAFLTLSQAEENVRADIRNPQQFRLRNHLEKIKDKYDYCIMDCAPALSITNINGLAASDEAFIPMRTDAWSIVGLCIARNLIDTVMQYNPNLKFEACFFTQWDKQRLNFNAQLYDLVREWVPELLPIKIGVSRLVDKSTFEQIPLPIYDNGKKRSPVTKQYEMLTDYILADDRSAMREKLAYLDKELESELK